MLDTVTIADSSVGKIIQFTHPFERHGELYAIPVLEKETEESLAARLLHCFHTITGLNIHGQPCPGRRKAQIFTPDESPTTPSCKTLKVALHDILLRREVTKGCIPQLVNNTL